MSSQGVIFAYYLGENGTWKDSNLKTIERLKDVKSWVHLDFKNEGTKEWLYKKSGLDYYICDALLEEDTRPRILSMSSGIFLTMRAINFNPGEDPEDMVALHVWLDKNRLITMRQYSVGAVEEVRNEIINKNTPTTTSELLINIFNKATFRIDEVLDKIYEGIEEIEDQILSAPARELRPQIASFRRMLIGIRRFIVPQKEMFLSLYNSNGHLLENDKIKLRETSEKLTRILDDVNAIKDRALVTNEELNNRIADQMNQTIYIMSIVATIFLPLSFLTGLLGINVGGLPGVDNSIGFWVVCLIIVFLAIIEYIIFKNRKLL
jgi:zinc transporter